MIFFNVLQLVGFAAQQLITTLHRITSETGMMLFVEGTIMLITLPENKNTANSFHCPQLKERKEEEEEEECVEQPAIPVLRRAGRKLLR